MLNYVNTHTAIDLFAKVAQYSEKASTNNIKPKYIKGISSLYGQTMPCTSHVVQTGVNEKRSSKNRCKKAAQKAATQKSDIPQRSWNAVHICCFHKASQKYGVKQSFSAAGRPHDNAVAESLFATFKKEEACRGEYTSERSFCKSVEQFVRYYNEDRPH